jgi:(4S)-4-hydroxy-5-phosphonooxypentane-2,3-dione isomerase
MSYCIVATYRVKAGEEDAVQSALAAMTPLTRNEPGCEFYRAHRSLEDAQVFFLYEAYRDEAAFQAHLASDYFDTHIRSDVWPRLEERTRLIASPIAGVDG